MITAEIDNIVTLKKTIKQRNIRLWVEQGQLKYTAPKKAMSREIKQALKCFKAQLLVDLSFAGQDQGGAGERSVIGKNTIPKLVTSPHERYLPFPMTELQQAYWVGEQGGYAQSCIPCFFHHVKFNEVTPEQLTRALSHLQQKHEVLRLRFFSNGTQVIDKPEHNTCQPNVTDLRQLPVDIAIEKVNALAQLAQQQLAPLDQGPPLTAHLVRLASEDRLLLSIRLNVIDGPSLKIIFHDLLNALFSPETFTSDDVNPAYTQSLSFRDYALAVASYRNVKSLAFWEKTLPTLPPAPDLPVTGKSPNISRFTRLQGKLNKKQWTLLKRRSQQFGISINAVLLALYAATLRPWSKNKSFCINMLLNYRPFYHPDMASLTGNCTNNTLIDCANNGSFLQQVKVLQEQLTIKLEHASVPGVSLLRKLQQRDHSDKPSVPFVFTSGVTAGNQTTVLGHADKLEVISNHLQTPQVWLDHQVVENNGELLYFWDYVDDIFLPNTQDSLFAYYENSLHALINDTDINKESPWETLPPAYTQQTLPAIKNTTVRSVNSLIDLLYERVELTPHAIALTSHQGKVSYQQLLSRAQSVATYLQQQGTKPKDIVAIQIEKSEAQMVTIIAISLCGAIWLPLDIRSPYARREQILKHSHCKVLVSDLAQHDAQPSFAQVIETTVLLNDNVSNTFSNAAIEPDDIAYIIYTSGSTGQPKGVVTKHSAVLNTIIAINEKFGVDSNDKILALSAASFDLSIYDLWGAIASGATLVIPHNTEYPDPLALLEQCHKNKITVWNSVPALLDMVLSVKGGIEAKEALSSLRIIMLSGDWIPLKLAAAVRECFPQADVYSLGGATEASIWSNYFPIEDIDLHWTSIPYGFPLSGQQLYVLDDQQNICLPNVTGEIHIAGKSLANGYLNDQEKTQISFFTHHSGERLYATGDLGRYRNNLSGKDIGIEFLGRKDFQLKIRGFRIEAGEIELQLEKTPGITASCVFSIMHNDNIYLVASYAGEEQESQQITDHLSRNLPKYMLPDIYIHQKYLPVTTNGKIDRKVLKIKTLDILHKRTTKQSLQNKLSEESIPSILFTIWEKIIGHPPTEKDNFFHQGGNSLLAVHLLNNITVECMVDITLADIFNRPTFEGLSQLIQEKS
jgi:amino acid adenylation domain-containing protein